MGELLLKIRDSQIIKKIFTKDFVLKTKISISVSNKTKYF